MKNRYMKTFTWYFSLTDSRRKALNIITFLFFICMASSGFAQDLPSPVVKNAVQDQFIPAVYSNPAFEGYLADRMKINLEKRLLYINVDDILAPYVNRPGVQEWVGEHVGKFLHAAALTYESTQNQELKERMDYAAKSLIATQIPDGYLGTYLEKDRWTSWDVWSHKYNMIGLLSYYKVTGYTPALESCKKMAGLLISTFGFEDGKKDIITSGTHVGMAPSSVLEPMVMLYRYTGEKAYLDFCQYLVKSWEQEHGPKIVSSLLQHGDVHKTANNKAYEMMSCLVGLADLYRITGQEDYFRACENAWKDIAENKLYIIGSASYGEHFPESKHLNPNGGYWGSKFIGPGEGCVTVTWMQLSWHLLRLKGEQKYVRELEKTTYNALLAAQNPNNGEVCYFLPLSGRKRYGEVTHGLLPDISCCSSSIPRGLALIPEFMAGAINGRPAVQLYANGSFRTQATAGKKSVPVELKVETDFPKTGDILIKVNPAKKGKFSLLLRVPEWADSFTASVGKESFSGKPSSYLIIERNWKEGDEVKVKVDMPIRIINDENKSISKQAFKRGPQLLATDENVTIVNGLPSWGWHGSENYIVEANIGHQTRKLQLVSFAEAGQTMADYNLLFEDVSLIGEKETSSLREYREQLNQFRKEFDVKDKPDVKFFQFGMGNRKKLLYKGGKLYNPFSGEVLKHWPVKNETIIPNEYKVEIETLTDNPVTVFENEEGVFIKEGGKETLIEGTSSAISLPEFSEHQYSEILKVLNHEILINILDSKPLPNFLVYDKPWRRDAAMMAMCLQKTDNLQLIKDWVMNISDPYDRNNAGETEADNLGQTLYLVSLFSDKSHPVVQKVLAELPKYEVKSPEGKYIKGRSDFHEVPAYQTKWLKYGLKSLGLKDEYVVPQVQDNYSSLFWWDYKDTYKPGTVDAFEEWEMAKDPDSKYPYIGWAADHFHGKKRNPISNRDYPLSWEQEASQASYENLKTVDDLYVKHKISAPHTWHAAEMFLYLLNDQIKK